MIQTRILRLLLWAMSQPRTFYILGAGTSFGLVPMTVKLGSFVIDEYDRIGIYPVSRAAHSPLFDRVLGQMPVDGHDLRRLLLWNIGTGTLELLVQHALCRPLGDIVPPQYAVFDVIGQPSTIFSFNLDGFASAYCRARHFVLEPHGIIDRLWLEPNEYQQWLYATAAYDLVLPHVSRKLLPGPEPSGITETAVYVRGRVLFEQCQALVLVGYSFGRREKTFDDAESFEYVVDLLRTHPRPTLVLSTSPNELVDLLQQQLHSRQVYAVPVRWELFSQLLLAATGQGRRIPTNWCDARLEALLEAYYRIEELGQGA
jgi:hypothetical protein